VYKIAASRAATRKHTMVGEKYFKGEGKNTLNVINNNSKKL